MCVLLFVLLNVCYVKSEVNSFFDCIIDGIDLLAELVGSWDGCIWVVVEVELICFLLDECF